MGLGDVLSNVGYAIDTPGALLRGLLAGKPGQRATGREALHLGPDTPGLDAGDVLGFLAEMALDPVNLLAGAGVGKLAKYLGNARGAAKVAEGVADARKMYTASKGAEEASLAEKLLGAASETPYRKGIPLADVPNTKLDDLLKDWVMIKNRELPKGFFSPGIPDDVWDKTINPKAINKVRNTVLWDSEKARERIVREYEKRLAESGGTNVVNPESGVLLWARPGEGRAALSEIAQKKTPINMGDWKGPMGFYGLDAKDVTVNPQNYLYGSEFTQSTAMHELRHRLTDSKYNMHQSLLDLFDDAAKRAQKLEDRIREKMERGPVSKRLQNFVDRRDELRQAPNRRHGDELKYYTSPQELSSNIGDLRSILGYMPKAVRQGLLHNQLLSSPYRMWKYLGYAPARAAETLGPGATRMLLRGIPAIGGAAVGLGALANSEPNPENL